MRVLFWLSIGLDRRATSEHLLTAIVEALYNEGHMVHLIQMDTHGEKNELPPQMAKIGVTTNRIPCSVAKRSNLIERYMQEVKYVLKCARWIRKNRQFERVFVQSSNLAGLQVFILRKLLKNIPIIYNVQDIFPENAGYSGTISQNSLVFRFLSAIQKYAYHHSDKIITISEDMRNQLIEAGTPENNITVIYNWSYQDNPYDTKEIDCSRIEPLLDKSCFNVVYGGNIGRMQNVECVIRAAEKLQQQKDIVFHIFGNGIYKEKLENEVQHANLKNVFFHSILDSTDAPALYSSADINIIPLGKNIYRTAFPSKTATCLACGRPIILAIGTDSIFGNMMAEHTNTLLVDPDDLQGLCSAIIKVKQNGGIDEHKDWEDYYKSFFSRSFNSHRYAEIIAEEKL